MPQNFKVMKRVAATCSGLPDHILSELIEEMAFPDIKDKYEDLEGDGMTIEVGTGLMEKIVMTIKTKGSHSELYGVFRKLMVWTFTGVVEDELTGEMVAHTVKARCRLGAITPDSKSRTGIHGHNLELNGHRTCTISEKDKELFDWAWGTGSPRFDGSAIDPEGDALLGLV